MLGSGPVYATLGNHDSYNQLVSPRRFLPSFLMSHFRAQDAPHTLGGNLAKQFSWYVFCATLEMFIFTIGDAGITITLHRCGNTNNGSQSLPSPLPALTMLRTWFNARTDFE